MLGGMCPVNTANLKIQDNLCPEGGWIANKPLPRLQEIIPAVQLN